ncbi:rhamnulokinase [Candidatus Fermentibacterales bacterium]|nr:rhamnulokinase [Candidatus Fermentibacterales bacterium]
MRCVAVDIGAGSGRLVLGSFRGDRLEVDEVHRFENRPRFEQGHLRWDAPRLLDEIRAGLVEACRMAEGPPDSVGVDTWGVDFALLDPGGDLLGLPVSYRDDRTEGMMEAFLQRVPASEVYEKTGIQFQRINTLYQLCAMARQEPGLLARASRLLMMPDYFHYGLCGAMCTELTDASTTQMIDLRTGDWDPGLLEAIPVRRSILLDPAPAGTPLGRLEGLPGLEGTLVVAPATHDTASAVAAVPVPEDEEWAFISTGSWCLMGVELPEPVTTQEARLGNFTNEAGVGGTIRFLRNLTGLWLMQGLRDSLPGRPSHGELEQMAEIADPFGCLLDTSNPLFFSPRSMTKAIDQFCKRTGQEAPSTPGAYARCALESIALSFARTLDQLGKLGPKRVRRVHMVGGGCRSALLCGMASSAMGVPVTSGPVEATAVGNLLVQAMALGLVPDLASARRLVYSSFDMDHYEPRSDLPWAEARERYDELCSIRESGL